MPAKYKRLPKGFRRGTQEEIACKHRDLSVCPDCATADFLVEVYGVHYFAPDGRAAAEAELGLDTETT